MLDVREDFKKLIPPLSPEEFEQLEKNILEEGIRDKIVLWGNVIIDGHNRYEIAVKHGLSFDTYNLDFENDEEAKDWMDKNQLGRRNLTADQRRIIIGRRYEREKAKHGGDRKSEDVISRDKNCPLKTAEKIAHESGVHANTVKNYAKDAAFFDTLQEEQPEVAKQVWSGETTLREVKKAHVSNNSGENEWYTPKHILDAARATFGVIDFDPASCELANQNVGAIEYRTKENSGLDCDWKGNVWMNPPYAQPLIMNFCQKAVEQVRNYNQAIILVNNATETAWFRELVSIASAVCFTNGRVKFIDKNGNPSGAPLQGQAIIYVGSDYKKFIENFKEIGWTAKIEA